MSGAVAVAKPALVLSDDQQAAYDAILLWLEDKSRQTLTFGGLGGTGKSTLVAKLLSDLGNREVAVCAFTGKAASVLRLKGIEQAQTLHSLIYQPMTVCVKCGVAVSDQDPVVLDYCETAFRRLPTIAADLVIVDEASMLSKRLVDDLLSYHAKVLFVGDHGQLEPIGDNPGIMMKPDIRLERIHRQAEGSPIIRLAHALREGLDPRRYRGFQRDGLWIRPVKDFDNPHEYDIVLCGYNRTRVEINERVRKARGHSGSPKPGEWVICLQNNRDEGVFNGQRFRVATCMQDKAGFRMDLVDEIGTKFQNVPVTRDTFGRVRPDNIRRGRVALDFGYAMTAHKSQGSEWLNVAVIEELHPSWTASRWRYTAATRASESLHYFV